jgi:uncharacterized protein YcfL
MKKLLLVSLLFLGACSSNQAVLIAPEYKIVKPPEDFYNCPVVKKFPKTENLTNQQVGSIILTLQKNNMVCKNSVDQIKKYMDEAEAKTSKR